MSILHHLLLNTGELTEQPLTDAHRGQFRNLDPLLKNKGGWVPLWSDPTMHLGLKIAPAKERCLLHVVARKMGQKATGSLLVSALAWSEDAAESAWKSMAGIARNLGVDPLGTLPAQTPLILAVTTPESARVSGGVLRAAADVEACVFWALLAREGLVI